MLLLFSVTSRDNNFNFSNDITVRVTLLYCDIILVAFSLSHRELVKLMLHGGLMAALLSVFS